MLKNHIKIALRSLLKNKLFTTIKLVSLTFGLTAFLLMSLYLHHETSFDTFHEKRERIARVIMEVKSGGELERNISVTGNKVAPSFREDFPEVEKAVRVIKYENVVQHNDLLFEEPNFYYADSSFFDIFTLPLLKGNSHTALNGPNKVVVSTKVAQKYFGTQSPVGKKINVSNRIGFQVTGVFAPTPSTSKMQPDFIASFTTLRDARPERSSWRNANYATFVLLHSGASLEAINQKIPEYMAARTNETGMEGEDYLTYRLEPLTDIHLRSEAPGNFVPNGDIRYIYILGLVAFLILLIGAITYVNLTTAQSTERAKEIGVQKVLGISRRQLFGQHIGEATVMTGIALFGSIGLTTLLLPGFNRLIDRSLTWEPLFHPLAIVAILGFGLLISFLAGAYPALVVSKFKPAIVLKGRYKSSSSGSWLQNSLIVLQFGISVFLIICTIVLHRQLNFIQNKKLGYDKDHVLVLPSDRTIVNKIDVFKTEFLQHKDIHVMSLAYESPVDINGGYTISNSVDDGGGKPVTAIPVDEDFVKTIGIQMVAGTGLNRADNELVARIYRREDTLSALPILINEAQCAAFGWKPEEAIDQYVGFKGKAQIKGVFNNFHFTSLHEPVSNLVVFPSGGWGRTLLVKIGRQDIAEVLSFLENKWTQLAPHRPFSYHFLDEEFEQMYGSERQTTQLVTTCSILAILLACLGLFGIATYHIIQRTKEIGIRKVLGATTTNILFLFSKNFLLLVFLGLLVAIPFSWYLMEPWLRDFAYRIDLKWWMFILPGVLVITVAFLTISVQSLRAALNNPVESLRSE